MNKGRGHRGPEVCGPTGGALEAAEPDGSSPWAAAVIDDSIDAADTSEHYPRIGQATPQGVRARLLPVPSNLQRAGDEWSFSAEQLTELLSAELLCAKSHRTPAAILGLFNAFLKDLGISFPYMTIRYMRTQHSNPGSINRISL